MRRYLPYIIPVMMLLAGTILGSTLTRAAPEPQYALIHACAIARPVCLKLEDKWGPYEDRPTCQARLAAMLEDGVEDTILAVLGPFNYRMACGSLEELRRLLPDAFEGVVDEPEGLDT